MWVTIGSGEAKGVTVRVEGERFVVGSAPECHLVLRDEGVAPLHAYFETLPDGRVVLHDLGSPGGTAVGGRRIEEPALLEGDEEIRLGEAVLVASVAEPAVEARLTSAGEADAGEDVVRPPEGSVAGQAVDGAPAEEPERQGHPPLPVVPLPSDAPPQPVAARERRRLRASVRRATALASAAAALAALAFVLVVTGVVGGGSEEPSLASVVRAAKPSTVLVSAKDARFLGRGSGWVLDAPRGLVVTNFHVVNGARAFEVRTPDGTKQRAELTGAAPCEDLAVLKLAQTAGLEAVPLGSQADIAEGDTVVAVGFPASAGTRDKLTATAGVVSVARSRVDPKSPEAPPYPNMIQTDAALSPGNSGGPLLDRRNRLVGVNTGILGGIGGQPVQGQGYAIGVDRVKEVVADLRRGRSRGWAGVGIAPRAGGGGRGVLAVGAVPGSPADRAGLGRGPVLLTAINGTALESTLDSYCGAVRGIQSGERAVFRVVARPGGRPRKVRVAFE